MQGGDHWTISGFVGLHYSHDPNYYEIDNSYSTGKVEAEQNIWTGFTGSITGSYPEVNNSFWDTERSGD
ncbi:hypothetical protein QA597_04715 [Marinilabiliaceae bacterium ANBcel2]|nr:hypothetical protein [Marinilabiliaceae bacterium ANBcel2]